jgi:hypothetical protein
MGGRAATAGAGAGLAPPPATVDSTSPLVTRPSRPVPGTEPAGRLLSAISLAAAGIATPDLEPPAGAEAVATALAVAWAGLAAAGAPAAGAAEALPSLSIFAITCSAITVPPSATTISDSTPALGAGTSSTTLSVSISIRISSRATDSPAFFFHCNRVASATDSDSWGTLTSTIAILFPGYAFSVWRRA